MSRVIAHQIAVPGSLHYDFGEPMALDDWELKELDAAGIDEIWYWYVAGSHEGDGEIIFRIGDRYGYKYAGHCSCYGPTEGIDVDAAKANDTLESIFGSATDELRERIAPLIDAAMAGK